MGIWRGGKEVNGIYRNGRETQEVWKFVDGAWRMIWQAIRSCFGAGWWINNYPWTNKDGWRNK